MIDVYVCCSKDDYKYAKSIMNYLEENDIKCWFMSRDIPEYGGGVGSIRRALKECKCVLVINTQDAYKNNSFPAILHQIKLMEINPKIINYECDVCREPDIYLSNLSDAHFGLWMNNVYEEIKKYILNISRNDCF